MGNIVLTQLPPELEDDQVVVCHGCIGEAHLKAEIRRNGQVAECDFCGALDRKCVSTEWLAERIDPVYRAIVGTAEEEPHITDNDNVRWIPNGEAPRYILTEMIQCDDEEIAEAIIKEMSALHSMDIDEFDLYDESEDIYAIQLPGDDGYSDAWRSFCHSLKHTRRFFSEDARKILDRILGPALAGKRSQFSVAIRTIGPNDEGRFLYRGRLAIGEAALHAIYAAPLKQLGPPPPAQCGPGRMNAAGIPVFYGSSDAQTCVAELRVPVGGEAVVGKFEIVRPLRLLDLALLEQIENKLSYFHRDFFAAHAYGMFVHGFHEEIKRAVIPGTEALEYLPTQVVAEYLWTRGDRSIDGIIFGSSQVSGAAHANIVLFPHSCLVVGVEAEQPRTVAHSFMYGPENEDDDRAVTDEVYLVPLAEGEEGEKTEPPAQENPFSTGWDAFAFEEEEKPAPLPALRYTGELRRVKVNAISYEIAEAPVNFQDDRIAKYERRARMARTAQDVGF